MMKVTKSEKPIKMSTYKILSTATVVGIVLLIGSCKVKQPTAKTSIFPMTDALETAFIGVSILDEASGEYLFQNNADLHFSPASNTKLLTTYATLTHFGDSLPGWRYHETSDTLYVIPQGDPTFLHSEFKSQRFFDLMKSSTKPIALILEEKPGFGRFGSSWSWNTWLNTYSPERSQMPMYENMVRLIRDDAGEKLIPPYFSLISETTKDEKISLSREEFRNEFTSKPASLERLKRPYFTLEEDSLLYNLLKDTLMRAGFKQTITLSHQEPNLPYTTFYTQKTDDVVSLMMKRSDNFIAEQLLLMVSKNTLGKFNEFEIKNSLIKNDFQHAIKTGRWADGSGLSRNNLFTPNEFVDLLKAMQNEFGRDRLSEILPHGNEGTLSGLYKGYENNIFGKTGTLNDHLALSGYITTKSGKKLIFSTLVNNHRGQAQVFRKAIESRLIELIEKY